MGLEYWTDLFGVSYRVGEGGGGGAGYHTLVGPFSAKFGASKMHLMY